VQAHSSEEIHSRTERLIGYLDHKPKEHWNEVVAGRNWLQNLRRKTLNIFNSLTSDRSVRIKRCLATANSTAHRFAESGRFTATYKNHTLEVKRTFTAHWNASGGDGHLMTPFSDLQLTNAIKDLKTRRAQGSESVPPEFFKQSGP